MSGLQTLMASLDEGRKVNYQGLAAVAALEAEKAQDGASPAKPAAEPLSDAALTPNAQRATSEQNSPVVDNGALMVQQEDADKALALVQRATKLLDGGLHRCREWGEVRDQYFHAGALFSKCGQFADSAEAYNSAAAISRIYGDPIEVATAIGFAIDACKVCDPVQAVSLLKEQVDIFAAAGRHSVVARAHKDIASISEQIGMDEEAIKHYRLAINTFDSTSSFDSKNTAVLKRPCLVREAHLTAQLGRFREAVPLFENLAKTCARSIEPTEFYFKASLCWFADAQGERYAGGVAKATTKFYTYQDTDPSFQKGVYWRLCKAVKEAFDKPSIAAMDAAWFEYSEYREIDEWMRVLEVQIKDNLYQYLLPFM